MSLNYWVAEMKVATSKKAKPIYFGQILAICVERIVRLSFFASMPSDWIERRENVIALGPSCTGETHVALGLGLAACQKGMPPSRQICFTNRLPRNGRLCDSGLMIVGRNLPKTAV